MADRKEYRVMLPPRWRAIAFGLVVLAVALALVGIFSARRTMQALTDRTLQQAIAWAEATGQQRGPGGIIFQPPPSFMEEQQQTVMAHMAIYGGLMAAAVMTVLVAMWLLIRVVRREVALAEMKSNFVADVSHELKTPLALIRMFAETLNTRSDLPEEKRREYYGIIERESDRLTNLINNILDFARIDAGRKQYTLQPTDVGAVVKETYQTFREQLDRDGFVHSLHLAEGLPSVDADRDAIGQIMINLINNAIKYSDDEKHLAIELAPDTRRGARGVLISVHDRGIGIRPADRAFLTEGFYRADDARVMQRTGTGLGLSLVKHIVEAHHGSLDVESRLVKGSTFRVFLPATPLETTKVGTKSATP